jgi:transcriptional regulator with XRE-family HTH domain
MLIGDNLKKLLKKRGYKQTEFCKIAGMQPSHFSKIFKNHRPPSLNTLILLADKLHCTTDELLGRS